MLDQKIWRMSSLSHLTIGQNICELFLSERFLARSAKNQANRKQMKYVTTQGTKSLAAKRHQYENPDAHVVDTWRDSHMIKSTKSFVNEAAQQDYEKMAAEVQRSQLERQSQQLSEASLNVSGVDSSPVDQYEILSKVLGERSDYQRGVGYRAKGKARKTTSSSTDQSQSQENTAATPNEDMTTMALMMKAMRETLQKVVPEQPSNLYDPWFDSFL
ncbi:uncharacterized protein LOC133818988 isoform X2 [Humulus lupulus]|uniref:uncharacterized protein LOC133818988 isoform X2 n=1 Tax=Humulus lupulus TaxID=3486 RepID=UPI002B41659F|nr:uncharacterized protein LOC133818988 isoform X2 [Humulus lupulus]